MVTLKVKNSSVTKPFEIGHAERILRLPNSQWELADDKYELSNNAIIKRPNKRADKKANV